MQFDHSTPCPECPWRKDCLAGWLGGNTPEVYADTIAANSATPCHMSQEMLEGDEEEAMCAGSLSVMANACIMPTRADEAAARLAVGRRDDTFSNQAEFYKHHSGDEYVPMIIRAINGGAP